jgi:hypothetical protein
MSSSSNDNNKFPDEPGTTNSKHSTKGVKLNKVRSHAEQRLQLIQLLTPPPSHVDDLRVMPVCQLNELTDVQLVKEALQLCTNDDPYGYTRSGNVFIPELLTFFTNSAKSRDQSSLSKVIKSHNLALKDIAKVDKYIRNADSNDDTGDDNDSEFNSDSGVDDVFTSVNKKMDYGAKRSIKKKKLRILLLILLWRQLQLVLNKSVY